MTEVSQLEGTIRRDFDVSCEELFCSLDKSLQFLNVKRQAYQGGTFVGNHVHKLLQVLFKILSNIKNKKNSN